jgi:hypothetical protein
MASNLKPDVEAMADHLEHLFGGDLGGHHEGMIEIAWTDPYGALSHAKLFDTSCLEEAAEFAAEKNVVEGTNTYVGAALRQPSSPASKRCSDGDVLALPALYADLDDPGAHKCAKAGYDKLDVKPTCVVVTGRHPHKRAQLWWRLDTPILDPSSMREANSAIGVGLGGDPSVTNPGRVMRLGGSVAWAVKNGRVDELTKLLLFDDRAPSYSIEHLTGVFQSTQKPAANDSDIGNPDVENVPEFDPGFVDPESVRAKILAGVKWHTNTLRLVGRYINRGLTDLEIHRLTDDLTLEGWTIEDTRQDVQVMADDTRKRWEISETAVPEIRSRYLLTSAEFVAGFIPPEFLIEGLLQRAYCYSLTAATSHGKTAVAILVAFRVATGQPLGDLGVEPGRVVFFAGENPDDARARILLAADTYGVAVNHENLIFADGAFSIEDAYPTIKQELDEIGGADLVIVDTAAAFFRGSDENSNVEAGAYARLLRSLTRLPGKPAVLIACHPTKNATRDNLLPRGGGAFIAEVDGNLTLWAEGDKSTTELSHQGKIRGPGFEPVAFKLQKGTCDDLKDIKGRPVWSVVALPMTEQEQQAALVDSYDELEAVLGVMLKQPGASLSQWAEQLGWFTGEGIAARSQKGRVRRVLQALKADGMVRQKLRKYTLTKSGRYEAERVVNGGGDEA